MAKAYNKKAIETNELNIILYLISNNYPMGSRGPFPGGKEAGA
jgi:hypothetical protein